LLTEFLPSEQPSCSWPSQVVHRIDLVFKFSNLRDVTAAAVNQTAAPATQTSPTLFDLPEIAGNAVGNAKRWVVMAKMSLFFIVDAVSPTHKHKPMLLSATRQQLHPSEPRSHTSIVI
jgi:hypothetical protein